VCCGDVINVGPELYIADKHRGRCSRGEKNEPKYHIIAREGLNFFKKLDKSFANIGTTL
jgi:hypothetical protein